MERLTFNLGTRTEIAEAGRKRPPAARAVEAGVASAIARGRRTRERYTWDYLWLLAFTALLFFRPQDDIRPLSVLHLSEVTALAGLSAMAVRRLGLGQSIVSVTPELVGVMTFGGIMLLTTPFSIWPGGSLRVFSDVYVKIILIFALMISTLTTPKRIQQMTWMMIVASGYIAARSIFDYVRGVHLVEGDRIGGGVGGMFQNPNDLALNLVTILAPTLMIVIHERRASRRILAAGFGALMLGALICTKSRSGFLGLIAMFAVVMFFTIRVRPGVVLAAVLVGAIALPMAPQSFWNRMDSILVASEDPTGSREARLRLMSQALQVFAENPLTGIGTGQFKNYQGTGMLERWRETHNVWLQVAAEMGIFGLLTFAFLVARAFSACFRSLRALRGQRRRRRQPATGPPDPIDLAFSRAERKTLDMNARGMLAGLVGWAVCSFFASVGYGWTFYYVFALAVVGRELIAARVADVEEQLEEPAVAGELAGAHA
jgi:O-antigen ligase